MKLVAILLFIQLLGCQTQRIEHHTRSAWHYSMSGGGLKDEYVRDDGTIVKYSVVGGSTSANVQHFLDSIELESKDEVTGEVTMHAILPEQLLTQVLVCLRDRNWDILFKQLLSKNAQAYFESRNDDLQSFQTFFETNRRELAKSMQKMVQGKQFGDTVIRDSGQLVELSFSPNLMGNFRYRKVVLKREEQFLKLHSVE